MNFAFNKSCQILEQFPRSAKFVSKLSALGILNRMTFVFYGQLILLSQRVLITVDEKCTSWLKIFS